jgi:hypothetical protein
VTPQEHRSNRTATGQQQSNRARAEAAEQGMEQNFSEPTHFQPKNFHFQFQKTQKLSFGIGALYNFQYLIYNYLLGTEKHAPFLG